MRELTENERNVLAYKVENPDEWFAKAVTGYGGNCVRRAARNLAEHIALPIPEDTMELFHFVAIRDELGVRAAITAEEWAENALLMKVKRWDVDGPANMLDDAGNIVRRSNELGYREAKNVYGEDYKTRKERRDEDRALAKPVDLTVAQRRSLEKVIPADQVDGWAAAKVKYSGQAALEEAITNINHDV
tara:strand:- start:1741 stop:2307 length:567 start_codon:yes stop_codon:yes gene_type:complete